MCVFYAPYGNTLCDELNLSQYSKTSCRGIYSINNDYSDIFMIISDGDIIISARLNSKDLTIKNKYIFNGTPMSVKKEITTRVVFGTNSTNGVYASSVIPLFNANLKNISISTAIVIGTEDNMNTSMSVTLISETGFTLACADSKVSGKTVNITFYYS